MASLPSPRPISIVLCADDYGLSPGVSQGIRELLAAGRVSATSCMVDYPEFAADGAALRSFDGQVDIGLHLTLTLRRPLRSVMADAYLRRLDRHQIDAEIERQLDVFTRNIGRPPDHIDGHQHVHVLPIVRAAVCEWAARVGAYVRNLQEPLHRTLSQPSALAAACLAEMSRPLGRELRRRGLVSNRGFRGTRNFRSKRPFRDLMRTMISNTDEGCLVICHPGRVDEPLRGRDPVTASREAELAYLASDDFVADLATAGRILGRLRRGTPR